MISKEVRFSGEPATSSGLPARCGHPIGSQLGDGPGEAVVTATHGPSTRFNAETCGRDNDRGRHGSDSLNELSVFRVGQRGETSGVDIGTCPDAQVGSMNVAV
jgi:hypothetical protein